MGSFFKRLSILLAVLIIAAGSYFAYNKWLRRTPLPEGLIQANGRIEGDHIAVACKFSGRIQELLVREGDRVKKGQTLVVLDDAQVRTRVEQAEKAVEVLHAKIEELKVNLDVQKRDVPLAIATAEADIEHARAMAAKAGSSLRQAQRDVKRFRQLDAEGAASRQKFELNELQASTSADDLTSARAAIQQAEARREQAELGWDRIRVREAEIKTTEAQLQQAVAALAEARSVLADYTIYAPSDGVIMTRMADIGEVVSAGAPLFDLVDLERLYLKAYIPEIQIGKMRLGLPARIYTDAFPDAPVDATVKYISSQAEFTPKEVQTPDERTKLVYAAKLYLDSNPGGSLTPGMPADAVIRWKEGVPWMKAQW
jgi:HlyD family secretion protein